MYVIALPGADDDGDQHQQPDAARRRRRSTLLAIVYLTLVWSLSWGIRRLERHLALPEAALMPDWAEPVARYILQEGLPNTLRVAVIAVIGSTLIGVVLGTLLTIHFRPLRAADPALRRGLPRPADPRDGLRGVLPAPDDLAGARVLAAQRGHDRAHRSGAARRWPRRRAAPCSRSRASSTTPRPRSASAGSAATPT